MSRFFDFSSGTFATVFGVEVYGSYSEAWWHRGFIKPIFRVGNRIRDGVWWLRYRIDPRHRYHLIDSRLRPGYHDVDELMLHGMFSLLRRYVEDEMGGADEILKFNDELRGHPDTNEPDGLSSAQADRQSEAVTLYEWWMVSLPDMKRRRDELLHLLYGGERRMTFEQVDGTELSQVKIRPFEGDEVGMHHEMRSLEERIEVEEQAMLRRLIEIRGSLWT